MNTLNKVTAFLSKLSQPIAHQHLMTSSYCKQCGRETRWTVHLGRSRFRCLECEAAPEEASKQEASCPSA